MKLTEPVVKQFENDQKKNGTRVALYNILWTVGASLLHDLGIKHISTSDKAGK